MTQKAPNPVASAGCFRLPHKSERGTAVVVVVMVTTLITAIGVFAVRAVSQVDQAVGYARQAGQTVAIAELGTSAVMAQLSAGTSATYVNQMVSAPETCLANASLAAGTPCYRLYRSELDAQTTSLEGVPLLQPSSATESGSFGPLAQMDGDFVVEMTDPRPTGRPVAGTDLGGLGTAFKYVKLSLTTTAQVRPQGAAACSDGVASATTQQAMRARVVVGPIAQGQ